MILLFYGPGPEKVTEDAPRSEKVRKGVCMVRRVHELSKAKTRNVHERKSRELGRGGMEEGRGEERHKQEGRVKEREREREEGG